jgi:hypothetical protein
MHPRFRRDRRFVVRGLADFIGREHGTGHGDCLYAGQAEEIQEPGILNIETG